MRAARHCRGLFWVGVAIAAALVLAGGTRATTSITFTGTAATGGTVEFDVTAGGTAITRFQITGVVTSCGTLDTTWTGSTAVTGGSFSYGSPTTVGLKFSGTFSDAQHATGTLYNKSAVPSCTSADVSWSAVAEAPPLNPHYTLSVSTDYTIAVGTTSITPIVSVTAVDGWSGTVSFDLAGDDGSGNPAALPTGFSKLTGDTYWQSIGDQGTTETPVAVAADIAPGTYHLLLQATDGSLSLNLPISVTVQESAPPPSAYTLTSDGPFSVDPGGTFTPTVTLAATGGWSGTASLDLSGRDDSGNPTALPAGFSKAGGAGTWVALGPGEQTTTPISVGADVAAGPYHLLIRSNDGADVSFDLPINVTVGGGPGPVLPSYAIVADPTSATIDAGSSQDVAVSLTADEGFTDPVTVCLFAQHEDGSPGASLPGGITTSPTELAFTSDAYGTPQTMAITADSGLSGSYDLNFGECGGAVFGPTFTLTVNSSSLPDFAFALDMSETTVEAGATITPTATITPDEGFSGTIQFSLAPIAGFTADLWDDLVVGGTNTQELPLTVGADVTPGDYTLEFVAHPLLLPLADKTRQLLVHVTAPLAPEATALVSTFTKFALGADQKTVSHGGTYDANSGLVAQLVDESPTATIHAPQIVADTSSANAWSPPVTFPLEQTRASLAPNPAPHSGAPADSTLNLTMLNGTDPGCSGCSVLPTQVTPGFDASISTATVPVGGATIGISVDVTPTAAHSTLAVYVDGGPGFTPPWFVDGTWPDLTHSETLLQTEFHTNYVSWMIADPSPGTTYHLAYTMNASNSTGLPFDYAPHMFVTTNDWTSSTPTTGTTTSIASPELGADGAFTFSTSDTVDWTGGTLSIVSADLPATTGSAPAAVSAGARLVEAVRATLAPGVLSVGAGDTFSGTAQWNAVLNAGDETAVPAATITASSDTEPPLTPAVSEWPLTVGGGDLAAGGELTTSDLWNSDCAGCLDVTTDYDVTVSPGAVGLPAAVSVTPHTDGEFLQVDIATSGEGFNIGPIGDVTFPSLDNGETPVFQGYEGGLASWRIDGASAGHTYELQIAVDTDSGGFVPQVTVSSGVDTLLDEATGTSYVIGAAGLGPNGAFTFSAGADTTWHGSRYRWNDVTFPATSVAVTPMAKAEVNEWVFAELAPGVTSVSSGDEISGNAQWAPRITLSEAPTALLAPSITASADTEPAFTAPPEWPLTVSGEDLTAAGQMFSMEPLAQGCPGCRSALLDFDATVTPGTHGGPVTISVTPYTDGETVEVDVNTSSEGDLTGVTYPTLVGTEGLLQQETLYGHAVWRIDGAVAGHTYELQVSAAGASGTWAPQVSVQTSVTTDEGASTGTSLTIDNPALGANGQFTFQAGNSAFWHGWTHRVNGVTFQSSHTADLLDGVGELVASTGHAGIGTTGNTLTFTYTADTSGLADGAIALAVPSGWSAPSTSGTADGFTTAGAGDVSVDGRVITVSGLTMAEDEQVTITYGDTGGGGDGATAPGSGGGPQTWQAQERSTLGGTLTDLSESPVITLVSPDGSGTMTASPSSFHTGEADVAITFTYTAAAGGLDDGTVALTVPDNWTTPSTTGGDPGYTTSTGGTVDVVGQSIFVGGLDLDGGDTFQITYAGATAPSTAAVEQWQTQEQSSLDGSLVDIEEYGPAIAVAPDDGLGTMDVDRHYAGVSTAGNTLVFTYTAEASGLGGGSVGLTVPAGWSAPSTTPTAPGYVTSDRIDLTVSGRTILVPAFLSEGETITIVYGDTGGGGPGATAPASPGTQTWQAQQAWSSGSPLTNLVAGSPEITLVAPDGSGTMTASPSVFEIGQAAAAITFTYTAAAGGLDDGTVALTAPDDWASPSTVPGDQGYTVASSGTVDVEGQTIYVTGLTLNGGQTLTITYHADAPFYGVSGQWETLEASSVEGTLTDIEAFGPTISVVAPDGAGTLETETTMVGAGSHGNTIVFTYTADVGGLVDGAVTLTVPAGWSPPSTSASAPGYITSNSDVTVAVAGQTATFSHVTLAEGETMDITYGDNETGATAPATAGDQTWQAKERSSLGGTLTNLAASPLITVLGPPKITSFSDIDQDPSGTVGIVGDTVVIHGTGFTYADDVLFGDVSVAGSFSVDDEAGTQITTWVPDGASTGKISIHSPGGTGVSAGNFTVIVEPVIDSFTPSAGKPGTLVTINGSGFTGVKQATFISATDVVNGTSLKVVNDTKVTVVVPAGAVTGPITLFNIAVPDAGVSTDTDFVVVVKPVIESVDPLQGIIGDTVTITGSGFLGATSVKFNGKPVSVADIDVQDDATIVVPVPPLATTGKVSVTNLAGTATSLDTFTVILPPTVTAFTPLLAPPGATVTISGTHLALVFSVQFGDGEATDITPISDTKISAVVPDTGTTGPITVTNDAGSFTSVKSFGVIVPPLIDSIDPLFGKVGATFSVTGSGFVGTNLVTFEGPSLPVKAKFKVVSDTLLTVTVPKGTLSQSAVTVTNPADSATSEVFTVVLAPTITSITTEAVGTDSEVIIDGTNFYGDSGLDIALGVTLNGLPAEITTPGDTEIVVTVPPGTTTGKVVVTNPAGKATSKTSLIVTGIKSFTPAQAIVGKLVTITGTHLLGTTDVDFGGGASTAPVAVTDTKVTAYVPEGGSTGVITLTTSGGLTAVSAKPFAVIVAPSITSFTQGTGLPGATVTISGTGFTGTTSVKFGLKAAKFKVVSDTQITTTVPLGVLAGVFITVTNPAGTATSPASFPMP